MASTITSREMPFSFSSINRASCNSLLDNKSSPFSCSYFLHHEKVTANLAFAIFSYGICTLIFLVLIFISNVTVIPSKDVKIPSKFFSPLIGSYVLINTFFPIAFWGRPVVDDVQLFEKLCLEGFQAGLAWIAILREREAFRAAFSGFDPAVVSAFGDDDIERLVGDAGIVRHRGKIVSTINNAQRLLELQDAFGSLAAFAWSYEPVASPSSATSIADLPSITAESTAMSRDLKRLAAGPSSDPTTVTRRARPWGW